jgi:hypothetical protein
MKLLISFLLVIGILIGQCCLAGEIEQKVVKWIVPDKTVVIMVKDGKGQWVFAKCVMVVISDAALKYRTVVWVSQDLVDDLKADTIPCPDI